MREFNAVVLGGQSSFPRFKRRDSESTLQQEVLENQL